MSKSGAIALLLLVVATMAAAQTVTVEYVSGTAEHNQFGDWETVRSGARLRSDVTVRLQQQAIVDLRTSSGRITLAAPGSFPLGELISENEVRSQNRDLRSFLDGVVANLLQGTQKSEVVVLGARAAEVPRATLEWVDEDETTLKEATALLEEGQIDEALELLEEFEPVALEPGPFRFLIGYALALKEETGPALEILRTAELRSFDAHYDDWIYLQAQLLFRAAAYDESLTLANRYTIDMPGGELAQSAMTLAGLCLSMLGHLDQARTKLESARDLDPKSSSGQAAQRALSQLTS